MKGVPSVLTAGPVLGKQGRSAVSLPLSVKLLEAVLRPLSPTPVHIPLVTLKAVSQFCCFFYHNVKYFGDSHRV
jgi:hypothetical protein